MADPPAVRRHFIRRDPQDVRSALEDAHFRKRLSASDRADYVALLRREVILVTPQTEVRQVLADPDDDSVLAAAVDGGARYLVTGDRALLKVGSFQGVEIVTVRQLVDLTATD